MAEKNVASAIANAYNSNKEDVLKLFSKLGDEGLAAEELNKKHGTKDSGISVDEVYKILEEIARTQGAGTVEKRQASINRNFSKS